MNVAHEKLDGLDRERVLGAVGPVLAAHGVDAVELVWRTDRGGWLLEVTVERPGSRLPGEGVTIDLCSDISRDLSAALDVADAIPHRYRLEVGSPGLERALYGAGDYARFSGQLARVKLRDPHAGQYVLHGTLHGLDEDGHVVVELATTELVPLSLSNIENARLVFEMGGGSNGRGKPMGARRSQHPSKLGSRRPGGGT
jgi:ribosome maturation factor RimP